MKLERDGEAIDAYTRYLAEVVDIDPDERDQITKDLQTMKSGLIKLTLMVKGKGALSVVDTRTPTSGSPVVNTYGPITGASLTIGVHPGRHTLRARAANGDESATWELDAVPGATAEHTFTIVTAPPPTPVTFATPSTPKASEQHSSRAVPWVLTTLGGAALIGGAVTGLIAMNKVSRLESRCPNDVCPAGTGLAGERESIKRYGRATDLLLIGGGVVMTTGAVWLLFSGSSSSAESHTRPDVACSGAGCTLLIAGAF
jgi:hypothetical protein